MNYQKYIEHKPESAYTQKMRDEIRLLSVSKDQLAVPFGSIIYRIQQFPADLDLLENVFYRGNEKDVIDRFVKEIQSIVYEIEHLRLHYYSEIKAGLDNRYDINIGELKFGKWIKNLELKDSINELNDKKLLPLDDYKLLMKAIKGVSSNNYDVTYKILRDHRILRWTADEILAGKKHVLGKTFDLHEAVATANTLLKIDELTLLQGKFAEVTNVYYLARVDKNSKFHNINSPNLNTVATLKEEVEKLYYSDLYYSPFKVIKRMFALAQNRANNKDPKFIDLIHKLVPFISSTTSLAYQIRSELDVMKLIIERSSSIPLITINNQLDSMKFRLSNYLTISTQQLEKIYNLIDKAIDSPISIKADLIDQIQDVLKNHINFSTIRYMNKVGINPPPRFTLPDRVKYDRSIVRQPETKVINPVKLIEQGIGSGLITNNNVNQALAQLILSK
jgi:hypothetical protein